MIQQTASPPVGRNEATGWTGRKSAVVAGVVVVSLVLALLVAWVAMLVVFNLRPPACDPWDCVASDMTEVIWAGLLAGLVAVVGMLLLGLTWLKRREDMMR